jgi:ABC-2 type transport system ATP-binding protein
MTEASAVVETKDLTKVYTDFWGRPRVPALRHLNLTIEKGEVFGLLGPNGSGKTTTIKLLLGLLFPTSGEAWVLGRPAGNVATYRRIGFLPEESYFYRFLNAEETLHFYGQLFELRGKELRKKTDELIELVGLKEARKRRLKEYSKGMARRIGLAQALINDPEFIFLDEPTSGLDPIGSREMKDLIIELRHRGKTVLLSSHLLADVEDICDRIAILHKGKLTKIGEVKELLTIKDITQIEIKNLSQNGLDAIKAVMDKDKGEIDRIEHPAETLESLFLKTIEESNDVEDRRRS